MKDKKYWEFLTKNKFNLAEKGYDDFSDEIKFDKKEEEIKEKKEDVVLNNDFIVEGDLIEDFRKKYK